MKFELPPPIPSKGAAPLKIPEHSEKETTAQSPKVIQRGSPPPPSVNPSAPSGKKNSAKQPQPSDQRSLEPAPLWEFEAGMGTTIPSKRNASTNAAEPPTKKGSAHLARDGQQTSPPPVVNSPEHSRQQDIGTQSEPTASLLRDQRRSTRKRWLLIGSSIAMLMVLGVLITISSSNPSHPTAAEEKPAFDPSKPFEAVQEKSAPASSNSIVPPETPAFDRKELAAKTVAPAVPSSSEERGEPASATPSGLSYDQQPGLPLTSPTPPAPQTYRVVNVREGDAVNIRQGPGSNYPVVAQIPPGGRGITLAPRRVANGSTMWQEISVAGYAGWVNEIYLEAESVER